MICLKNKNGDTIEKLAPYALADITTKEAQKKLQQAYLYSHVFQCGCGISCFVRKRGDLYYTAKFPNQKDHDPGCVLSRASQGASEESHVCHLADMTSIELTLNDIETKRAELKLTRFIGNLFNSVSGANLDKPSSDSKHKFSVKKRAEGFQICQKPLSEYLFLDWLPTQKQINYFKHKNQQSDFCQALALLRVNVTTYSDEIILKGKKYTINLDSRIVCSHEIKQGSAIAAVYFGYKGEQFEPIFAMLMHTIDEYSLIPAFSTEEKSLLRSVRTFKTNNSEIPTRIYRAFYIANGHLFKSSLMFKRKHQHILFTSKFNPDVESASIKLGLSPVFTDLDGGKHDEVHATINLVISNKLKQFNKNQLEGSHL